MNQSDITLECIRTGNKLLRGELSAIQTYELAIKRHPGLATAFDLDRISREHKRSARLLTSVVRGIGGEPTNHAGPWGVFANSAPTTANFLGAQSMVESLREGEEQSRNDYEDALDAENTTESFKTLIRADLLTSIEDHITSLERLQSAVA
ncbi:MAG: DUF2383 domain-containing protein [Verrucomicrobiales bacterium]